MTFKFVKESIIEDIMEGEVPEFQNEPEDEIAWDELQSKVQTFLSKYSHDEESEDAPDGPGFLIQDIADGTWTIGTEFNDPSLLSKEVLAGLADILAKESPSPETRIIITFYHNDSMDFMIVQSKNVFIPNIKSIKNRLQ